MPQNLDIFSKYQSRSQANQKLSIQLFGPQSNANQKPQESRPIAKKNQNFRKQIRRLQNQKMFTNIRNQMMNHQESQQFFSFLVQNSQKFDINQKNLETLIQCIKKHMISADFTLKIQQGNLRIYEQMIFILIDQSQVLSTYTKAILVKGLVYLTYYSTYIARGIASQKIIDFSIRQIEKLIIDDDEGVHYLYNYISLMLNLTSIMDQNINCYFIESSLINLICQKLDLTFALRNRFERQEKSKQNTNFNQTQQQQRQQKKFQSPVYLIEKDLQNLYSAFIQLLRNLCRESDKPTTFVQRIISYLMQIQFAKDHNTSQLFQLLTEIFKSEQSTDVLMANPIFSQWYGVLTEVCQIKYYDKSEQNNDLKLTTNQKQCFSNFLLNIITVDQVDSVCQLIPQLYAKVLINWRYLSQFLIQSAEKNQNCFVKYALQVYQIFSKRNEIQLQVLLTVKKGRSQDELIRIFTHQKFFCYFKTGKTLIQILISLLSKSSEILKTLMELKLFQSICSFFQNQFIAFQPTQSIILIFDLLTLMVECQSQIRREGKNQIARIIVEDGLIKNIQKAQNHQKSQVFQKAEMFIKYLQTFL